MQKKTLQLEIRKPGKAPLFFPIEPGIYSIGRDPDCKIELAHHNVEEKHAVLTIGHDDCWLEDLDAETGTFVNGTRIHGRVRIVPAELISIGPFILAVLNEHPGNNKTIEPPPQAVFSPDINDVPVETDLDHNTEPAAISKNYGKAIMDQKQSVKHQIHRELLKRMDIKRLTASNINHEELRQKAMTTIEDIVNDVRSKLPAGMDPSELAKEICDEALGLGSLEDFLKNPDISEIMVNGPSQIYIEKNGKLLLTDKVFMNNNSVLAVIERIVSPIGRRIDESQPYVDARLPDGSRVNAIIPPLSLVGPCLTIRKFSRIPLTAQNLIDFGTMTRDIVDFVKLCIALRKNIIVSGGTGCGKTTLLNVLSAFLPENERILTIEDAAELKLKQAHVVRLESRPPNIEGKGAITIRDLVNNSLRMRPDRIVVGECRGGEALDMLQAMNTGHDGSLTTIHANSPRDVISRLETMVLMSGMDLPTRAIREQIASAIDLIIHESRFSDGTRKVTNISEIVGLEGEQITMQDIFMFKQTGVDENGKVLGHFKPTGSVPTFMEEARTQGLSISPSMFDPTKHQK